ncbi:hypothetical protein DPMN_040307 [Dreissena polymorpha]|uniref:Uncharacterized protein n=1 Tax=Dreissena polymorpha TaxID=45954 RepID=A0A9D4HV31_DREPO|nr:hypothetical protein DPMN_040307 [Dreissena polymorpha]
MIDGLGGAVKVNNFLSALDMKEVHLENLKLMETGLGNSLKLSPKSLQKMQVRRSWPWRHLHYEKLLRSTASY